MTYCDILGVESHNIFTAEGNVGKMRVFLNGTDVSDFCTAFHGSAEPNDRMAGWVDLIPEFTSPLEPVRVTGEVYWQAV